MSCQSSVCEFAKESVCGTRHRSGTCGKTRHLVRPEHSKQSDEVCPLSRPCVGVEQVGEWLAGAGERKAGGGTKDRHTRRTDGQTGRAWPLTELHARPAGIGRRDARGDGSDIEDGRAASQAWPLRGSCSSHASRTHTIPVGPGAFSWSYCMRRC